MKSRKTILVEDLSSNPVLQELRTYSKLYEDLFLLSDEQRQNNEVILLLPSSESLKRVVVPQSLIEAHILLSTPLPNHYLNLLGHGLIVTDEIIRGTLGFDRTFACEILLEEFVTDGKRRFKVFLIDSPISDEWMQSRQDEHQLPTSPKSSSTVWTSDPFQHEKRNRVLLEKTSPELSVVEVGQIIESWKAQWPQFSKQLDVALERLERSLLLVPGYEQSVAQKYNNLVKTSLLPSLYQAQSTSRSLKVPPASTTTDAMGTGSSNQRSTKLSGNDVCAISIDPSNENKLLITDILERFLYAYFQSQLWTYIVASNQKRDAVITFVLESIIHQGLNTIGDGPIGLLNPRPHSGENELCSKPKTLAYTGQTQVQDPRHMLSQAIRISALCQWLSDRNVKNGFALLVKLAEKGGCIEYLKQMSVSSLPHEKLHAVNRAVLSACSKSIGTPILRGTALYISRTCISLLLTTDIEQIYAHLQSIRMVAPKEETARNAVSVNLLETCLQTILQQAVPSDQMDE